jgi:hypothetical protein
VFRRNVGSHEIYTPPHPRRWHVAPCFGGTSVHTRLHDATSQKTACGAVFRRNVCSHKIYTPPHPRRRHVAPCFGGTSVHTRSSRRHIPEDGILQIRSCSAATRFRYTQSVIDFTCLHSSSWTHVETFTAFLRARIFCFPRISITNVLLYYLWNAIPLNVSVLYNTVVRNWTDLHVFLPVFLIRKVERPAIYCETCRKWYKVSLWRSWALECLQCYLNSWL